MERNREVFKSYFQDLQDAELPFNRLFPADLFGVFIDIGHYVREIKAYDELVSRFNSLPVDDLKQISENLESINQNKTPAKYIGNYAILDHLGSGAFGSVYKVRKRSGQNLLAMKEINLHNPAFGKDKKDRDNSVENIVSELTIIREQLYHPNVVRYYRTFLENDRLYIVMELIEGAPLGEHFNSLKEKKQHFTEERLWNIFIQLCLALRYLHKEKRIVHRDLTPNNIMLGEKDKVTIRDSGYALMSWLITPLRHPRTNAERNFNRSHVSTRNTIERAFGLLKSRFRCLHVSGGALLYDPDFTCRIIITCATLHNICVRHNVPLPEPEVPDPSDEDDQQGQQPPDTEDVNPRQRAAGQNIRDTLINNLFTRL